jgi:hypothetical protein
MFAGTISGMYNALAMALEFARYVPIVGLVVKIIQRSWPNS